MPRHVHANPTSRAARIRLTDGKTLSTDLTGSRDMHVTPNPARDAKAIRNLRAFAADQPNPDQWLTEMCDILGLTPAGQP